MTEAPKPKSDGGDVSDRTVDLPVVFDASQTMQTAFANHAVASHTSTEVFLTFGLVAPPTIRTEADLDGLSLITAEPVIRIVMTPDLARRIGEILLENDRILARRRAQLDQTVPDEVVAQSGEGER